MAASRFEGTLQNSTSKITQSLIYAASEWILILFLFLNSLFSYMIFKFSDYFGLRRPCLLCSRLEPFFDSTGYTDLYQSFLCQAHIGNLINLHGYFHSKCCFGESIGGRTGKGVLRLDNDAVFTGIDAVDDEILVLSRGNPNRVDQSFVSDHSDKRGVDKVEERECVSVACCADLPSEELSEKLGPAGSRSDKGEDDISCDDDFVLDLHKHVGTQCVEENDLLSPQHAVQSDEEWDRVSGEASVLDLLMAEHDDKVEKVSKSEAFSEPKYNDKDEEHEVEVEKEQFDSNKVLKLHDQDEMENEVIVSGENDHILPVSVPETSNEEKKERDLRSTGEDDKLSDCKESVHEEYQDRSITAGIDANDNDMNVEELRSALVVQRNALNALYAELEEERSASAVAASQTMAMINRLQEEKAAMQMEALQYQRMMEEQYEHDQEALELLNELLVTRDREKADLQQELETNKKKIQVYEVKERILKRMRSGSSSVSCNHVEEIDDGLYSDSGNGDACDESRDMNALSELEDERDSILEQIRVLEDKFLALSEEEEHTSKDHGSHSYCDGRDAYSGGDSSRENVLDAKKILPLPLFEKVEAMNDEEDAVEEQFRDLCMVGVKLAVEEMDHVYRQLEAFEADIVFLKQCIVAVKKGDKGLGLLREILHLLHDLTCMELSTRNTFAQHHE